MTATNDLPASRVGAYLSRIQTEATSLEAVLQGIDILSEDDRGRNAIAALTTIAL